MAPIFRNLFQCRAESFFDTNVAYAGVLLSISEALVNYNLFHNFQSWDHPDIHIIQTCLADEYPDLVAHLHTQARLMSSFGLNRFRG